MITQSHLADFEVALTSGEQPALEVALELVRNCPMSNASERGAIHNSIAALQFSTESGKVLFKQAVSVAFDRFFEDQKANEKAKAKAAKASAPKKASIKKITSELLAHHGLSERERAFLGDISTKRKLTEKQAHWLRAIAIKCKVKIVGDISEKTSTSQRGGHCDHEDLGSLGYRHGDTVKCPHCGQMAEVW